MAISIETIKGYLKKCGIENFGTPEEDVILFGTQTPFGTQGFIIRLLEDGGMFRMSTNMLDENNNVLSVKEHKYLNMVLAEMLFKNYQTKFGTWEYNTETGEIVLTVEIPVEDGTITLNQFKRIMDLLVRDGGQGFNDIKYILKHGKKQSEEEIKGEILDFMKKEIEKMEKELKSGGKGITEI